MSMGEKIQKEMGKLFFKDIDTRFVQEFGKRVQDAKSIVISSHISPDDDSISSVLGVHYYLTEVLEIPSDKVHILYTGEKVGKWNCFERFAKIEFVDDIHGFIKPEDLVIFTDGSGWGRFSRKPEISELKNSVICIDHHQTPQNKFDLHLVAPQYTSTAEVVYRLFYENQKQLSKEICEILLMGILGDTGNFRFVRPDQAEIFAIAGRLVKEGNISVEALQNQYQYMTVEIYKALQELMKNSSVEKVEGWPDFLVTYMTAEFAKENSLRDVQVSDASANFTPYLKGLKGIEWGVVITPREDGSSSLSGRSIPNSVSIRDMMERMKIGGGHDRAAGGRIDTADAKEALKKLMSWMEKNKPLIV